jgi:hypothetical protein
MTTAEQMSIWTAIRHAHRPWRVSRWVECGGGWVVWSLYTAACPHCPECHGEGGRWTGGPHGDEPDFDQCSQCGPPLLEIPVPAWLDRAIPGSPARYRATYLDDEPPF